jgi:hypothetical protein
MHPLPIGLLLAPPNQSKKHAPLRMLFLCASNVSDFPIPGLASSARLPRVCKDRRHSTSAFWEHFFTTTRALHIRPDPPSLVWVFCSYTGVRTRERWHGCAATTDNAAAPNAIAPTHC